MRTLSSFWLLLSASFLSLAVYAHSGHTEGPRRGIHNEPTLPGLVHAGETVTICGEFCFWHLTGDMNKSPKCRKTRDSEFEVKGFFPDVFTEIPITITKHNDNGGKEYRYCVNTPAINGINMNVLTMLIESKGGHHTNIGHLLHFKAKVERQLMHYHRQLEKMIAKGSHPDAIQEFQAKIARLIEIKSKLQNGLNARPSILSRLELPLQVDNNFTSPFVSASMFDGYRLALEAQTGALIEGDKTQVIASIHNLRRQDIKMPSFENTEEGDQEDSDADIGRQFFFQVIFGGQTLFQSTPAPIPFDARMAHTFSTGKVRPENSPHLRLNLVKYDIKDGVVKTALWGRLENELSVIPDTTPPEWISSTLPDPTIRYAQNFPSILSSITDPFGRIDPTSIVLTLESTLNDGTQSTALVQNLNLETLNQGITYQVSRNLNPLPEGEFALHFDGNDLSGLAAERKSYVVRLDRTGPSLMLSHTSGPLTNNPNLNLNVDVFDHSPKTTTIRHQDAVRIVSTDSFFVVPITLFEGLNFISADSIDSAQNAAQPQTVIIELDTIAPQILNVTPANGAMLNTLAFTVSGASNEKLSQVLVNNSLATLSQDQKSFSMALSAPSEGPFSYVIVATDLVGNSSQITVNVEIVLKVLVAELIKVEPNSMGTKLLIIGAQGATRPGLTVYADAGLFNKNSAVAGSNGAFQIEMAPFASATVTATSSELNRTDTVNVSYAVDTSLSGVVRDTQDMPLPGATITIADSNQSAVTDSSGNFRIVEPVTGDQMVVIDGTTIPPEVTGPNRKFSKTVIKVSIGVVQSNVIERPIYLAALMYDGTETEITSITAAVVTSPHAPGVELSIPAGATTFPDGTKSGVINMTQVDSDKTTIDMPEYVTPEKVIALEPSGVVFSEPVPLTLPNENQFPPGMDLVILSKNSATGEWEIDGTAKVSDDANRIETTAGGGITHFSEVFCAPLSPELKQIGGQDKPGVDAFNGALTTSISLPSYKSLGEDHALGLIYKSIWASPSAVVTNLFDVPRNEVYRDESGTIQQREYTAEYRNTSLTWIQPEWIETQFFTEGIASEPMRFTGVPQKSVISYAMDLRHLDSDVYPYLASFKIKLNHMAIRTTNMTATAREGYAFKDGLRTLQLSKEKRGPIASQIFPSDLLGTIYVQNKMNSHAGRGWKIAGIQKILNPSSSRIAVEESDGSIAPYTLNNTIETVLHNPAGLQAADISSWPNAYFSTPDRGVKRTDLSIIPNSIATVGQIPNYEGMVWRCMANRPSGQWRCSRIQYTYQANRQATNLLALSDGSVLGSDNMATIFKLESSNVSLFAGFERDIISTKSYFYWGSSTEPCVSNWSMNPWCTRIYSDVVSPYTAETCPPAASGRNPRKGFVEGSLTASYFNQPMGLTRGSGNTLAVADYGNNRVRLINPNTNLVSTIAGNGQTYDLGDGGPAIEASMLHPMGVIYDSYGNLYISTENGFIRKVDTSGRITKVAGLPLGQGGILANSAPADKMAFSSPRGMAIDEEQKVLYVADTGFNRVVKIDMENNLAEVIAGSSTCITEDNIGDSGPALDASLCKPVSLGFDDRGNLLVADEEQKRIRRIIFDFAETGTLAFSPLHKDNSSLVRNADGTFIRTYRNGTKVFFNAQGLQISSEDRVGRTTTISYEDERPISISDSVGKTTTLSYSGGVLSSIIDPSGRITNFAHDGTSLTQVIFPDQTSQSFVYEDGLLIEEANARGNRTKYQFSPHKRLAKVIRSDNSEIALIDATSGTIGNGYTSGNTGALKSFGTGDGQTYDGVRDAKNIETKFVKDINGYVDTIIDGEGKTTKIERNLSGDPTKIIRPDETFVTFTYDNETRDLLSRYDSSTDAAVSSTYNSYGQILTETNAHGLVTNHIYDPITGLETQVYNSAGQSGTKTYESFGLLKDQINSLGQKVSFEYFPEGNLKKQIAPDLSATSFERDGAGNITKITNAKNQILRREFDLWNRLTAVVSAKNERTEYQYQETGDLIKIKDPLNQEVNFYYNSLNQMYRKVDQLGHEIFITFDKNGNVETERDPNGNLKAYSYDNMDRLVKKTLPDNIYEFDFDLRGNLILAKNNITELEFEYVATEKGYQASTARSRGLGAKSDYPDYELNFDFDSSGNRILMETLVGNFTYGFDLLDRQTSLTNHKGENFSFAFDLGNRLRELTRPNGKTQFDLDSTNFLTSIIHKKGGDIVKSILYERDEIGNRTRMTTPSGDFIFGYDSNNQLLNSSNPEITGDFASEIFNYDEIGNRTDDQLGDFFFDTTKQRLAEDYRYYYYHDNNGNLTSKQSKTLGAEVENFIYNSENQLIRFERYENNALVKSADYFYNAFGQRVEKVVVDHQNSTNNLTRRFVYHDNEILHEMDSQNQILSTYTHSGLRTDDTLAVDITNAGVSAGLALSSGSFHFLKDGLGSITEIANSAGDIIQRHTYSAFGKLLSIRDQNNQETSLPILAPYFTYTNREFDAETGLLNFRPRYLDPSIGRFIQEDGYPGMGTNPMSVNNNYSYVENDPINLVDPSGESGIKVHGNYCGPSYSTEGSTPEDQLDVACEEHDEYTSGSRRGSSKASRRINAGQADMKLSLRALWATPDMMGPDPSHRPVKSAYGTYKALDVAVAMGGLGMIRVGWGNITMKGANAGQITGGLVLAAVGAPIFVVGVVFSIPAVLIEHVAPRAEREVKRFFKRF